jgi:hypothetical protein
LPLKTPFLFTFVIITYIIIVIIIYTKEIKMGKKRTEELTTREILSLKRKRPNSPDEEAIYVNPVDNNEKFIGT